MTEKKSRGRPRVGSRNLILALPPDVLAALDAWIAAQPQPMSRQDAIRAMITAAPTPLTHPPKSWQP